MSITMAVGLLGGTAFAAVVTLELTSAVGMRSAGGMASADSLGSAVGMVSAVGAVGTELQGKDGSSSMTGR